MNDGSAEARRQQSLLAALMGDGVPALPEGALRGPRAGIARGFEVYRANAGASAERALAAAFPTVAALVGGSSMAALARAFWRTQPPLRGDLGEFGAGLPAFIADSPTLADEPYLADCAALDWALHQAARAADEPGDVSQLERLGDTDPAQLHLRLRAGTAVLRSRWPTVTIYRAHALPAGTPDRFAEVREALAAGRAEAALVWREGWRPQAEAIGVADATFMQALLDGAVLTAALDAAGAEFNFSGWLGSALQRGWLVAVLAGSEGETP